MPSIRTTKTASGATAVQVIRYEDRKVVILKHVGSGRTEKETAALVESAEGWMREYTGQRPLFAPEPRRHLAIQTARLLGSFHTHARDVLCAVAETMGFGILPPLCIDLALMRIIEPASKLRTIELMERYFRVRYERNTVYRLLRKISERKKEVEDIAVAWAKCHFSSDLSLVLYDVTTLYFETFESDGLRVPGFSKDNKSQQPQIVIGLLVTRDGFPLGYEVFKGNTFEGHTMLPILKDFSARHGVKTPTVVADAAMLSRENIKKLQDEEYSYIVGARLANTSPDTIVKISEALAHTDGMTVRRKTAHGDLVCAFSNTRYRKDRAGMEAQVKKAKALVKKREPGRRAKFVQKKDETYSFDEALHAKVTLLLGIKGYYTNIPEDTLSNTDLIIRYRDLWHVEAAFRMSKSDLSARPIFLRMEDTVKAHILVCFVALAMGKHIEMQTGLSLRSVKDCLWAVSDAHVLDTISGETTVLKTEMTEETKTLLTELGVSY